MKTISHLFMPALFLIVCISCNLTVDEKLVVGDWKGVEWLVAGQEAEYDATSTFFSFKEDGKYTYQYADMGEEGDYYVVNNELFTTPNGGMKMMVKIKTLTQDTMILNMNRGGTSETLTLARK